MDTRGEPAALCRSGFLPFLSGLCRLGLSFAILDVVSPGEGLGLNMLQLSEGSPMRASLEASSCCCDPVDNLQPFRWLLGAAAAKHPPSSRTSCIQELSTCMRFSRRIYTQRSLRRLEEPWLPCAALPDLELRCLRSGPASSTLGISRN